MPLCEAISRRSTPSMGNDARSLLARVPLVKRKRSSSCAKSRSRKARSISDTRLACHLEQDYWLLARVGDNDIQWFRRGRECQHCGTQFLTSEVQETFLDELVELRDALGDLKKNAERYVGASKDAEASLHELTESLQVLRALQIYKST